MLSLTHKTHKAEHYRVSGRRGHLHKLTGTKALQRTNSKRRVSFPACLVLRIHGAAYVRALLRLLEVSFALPGRTLNPPEALPNFLWMLPITGENPESCVYIPDVQDFGQALLWLTCPSWETSLWIALA